MITDILPLGELRVESLGSRTLFTDDQDSNSVISKFYVKGHRLSLIKLRKGDSESSFF